MQPDRLKQPFASTPAPATEAQTEHEQPSGVSRRDFIQGGAYGLHAKWLIEKKICLVGADTWAAEAVPEEEKDRAFECHQWLLTMNGIYIHENLDVEQLAADRVYEFAYIFSPLRLKGATGSPGNPIAVV